MKYNRINIKWCLVSTSFKIYLDILSNLYITFTIFYYNTISLKCTFFSCSSYRTLSNRIIQFTCNIPHLISFSSFWSVDRKKIYILDRQQIASQWGLQLIFRMHNSDPTPQGVENRNIRLWFKCVLTVQLPVQSLPITTIECWKCSDSVLYMFSFYHRLWKKHSWVAIV
jgi:hypothetical protein